MVVARGSQECSYSILQEQEFVMNALRSMKGGDIVVRTYIQQAIEHSKQFKKSTLVVQMHELLEELAPVSELADGSTAQEETLSS